MRDLVLLPLVYALNVSMRVSHEQDPNPDPLGKASRIFDNSKKKIASPLENGKNNVADKIKSVAKSATEILSAATDKRNTAVRSDLRFLGGAICLTAALCLIVYLTIN